MDAEVLRSIFNNLGFGQISDEDLAVLIEAADGDGDGRVSVQDFREMCASARKEDEVPKVVDVTSGSVTQKEANDLG